MLGTLIRKQREAGGITLKELENRIGMKDAQISRYENGKTELKEEKALDILIRGFNIPYNEAKDMIAEFKINEAAQNLSEEARINIFGDNNINISGSGNVINTNEKELIEGILKSKDKEDIKEIIKSGETKSLMKLLKSGKLDYLKKLLNID